MFDVIVVGGGPIGSYAAHRLAHLGHDVVVLEKKKGAGEGVCCTGIVGQECVRSFAIEDNVILRQVRSARLFSPAGKTLYIKRDEVQASILDRVAFDTAMAGRAQNAGAKYIFNSNVKAVRVEPNYIEVSGEGEGNDLAARAAVIATGFGSELTAKLGLGKVADFVIGAQAEVSTTAGDEVEVYFGRETAPGFFGWLVPTLPGNARVGLLSRRFPGRYLRRLLELLVNQGKIMPGEWKPDFGGIPLRPLTRTYRERLVVVGDAAGQVKPTSGGGIYYGLLCAEIAADTLHQALQRDDLSAKSLARYERGWKRRLGRELMIGYWARKLFERLSDSQVDRLFDVIKNNHVDTALLNDTDISFDWHSRAIVKMLRRAAIAKALGAIRLPSRSGDNI